MHSKRLIASITKIMTATLAIESGKLNDVVEVSPIIKKAYGSGIYIEVGEEITLKDLVYGLMLRSGNDAAMMISEYIGGTTEEFVNMMNKKAKELGLDAIHDTVHEMCKDEARHGKAFLGLLERHFGKQA